MPDILQ